MQPFFSINTKPLFFALRLIVCLAVLQLAIRPADATTLRSQDEFWIASTRTLPSRILQPGESPPIQWLRYRASDGWNCATGTEFLDSAKQGISAFYVPGNRIANETAEQRGWKFYSTLVEASDELPLRVVVWSWPSDQIRGLRNDVQVKAERTAFESHYLAWVLSQFEHNDRVSLLGYSYGARIISGALHIAAAGGQHDPQLQQKPSPLFRAVLMASATPNYWMLPGQFHQNTIQQTDQMLILYNPRDIVLKRFYKVDECSIALGSCGFDASELGAQADRIQQRDVGCEVGSAHQEQRYYCSWRIQSEIQRYCLWRAVGEVRCLQDPDAITSAGDPAASHPQ